MILNLRRQLTMRAAPRCRFSWSRQNHIPAVYAGRAWTKGSAHYETWTHTIASTPACASFCDAPLHLTQTRLPGLNCDKEISAPLCGHILWMWSKSKRLKCDTASCMWHVLTRRSCCDVSSCFIVQSTAVGNIRQEWSYVYKIASNRNLERSCICGKQFEPLI
jgi:hypothetical protein